MKRTNLFLYIISTTILFLCVSVAEAQENIASNYYYNNFDGGQLGSKIVKTSSNVALQTSAASPLSGAYSLASVGNGLAGAYQISALTANAGLNSETFGWEWTMIYKNTGGNTDNSDVIDNNKNAWKYWLYADNSNLSDMKGYYLTQNGSTLSLSVRINQYDIRSLLSFDLSSIGGNNTTYAIRVQRVARQGQYVWQLFVDPYTSSKKEASTARGGLNYQANLYSSYNYSGLQVVSTTDGRFKFDEVKVYSMKISISGANDSSYGISNPLYPGLQNAAIYGLKIETRGYFDIYQMRISLTGNITDIVEGTMKLNKSKDGYFGNSDDSFVANLSYDNGSIQNYNISDSFYSLGEANGSLALAFYYFISVNIKNNPTNGATFSISGTPDLNGSSSQANYNNTGSVVNVGTGSTNTGSIRDWVGGSSDWNTNSNWSPNTVPGANDVARIGVATFTNQPIVTSNKTVGNIIFGTAKTATLTVNSGATLTVNNNIENKAGIIITGEGSVDVKGTYISAPTSAIAITGSITALTVNNLTLNSQNGAVAYTSSAGNTTIKNALITSGSNVNSYTLSNNATVTFNGTNSLALAGNYSISFTNGTVVYGAAVQQVVPTSTNYKNITFSGAGVKQVGAGTLSVSGNWNSAGGKVDLGSNNTAVSFNGTAQTITDTNSDSGNGVSFGNVTFAGGNTKTLSATGKFAVAVGKYLNLAGNTTLQTSGNLTLRATVEGSASVGKITDDSSIQGSVTVEKYIQGGSKDMWRTHRMLSSPVYDNANTFINADGEGNRKYSFSQFIDDIIITGKGGAANGFDINAANTASAWTYNSGFVEIPNINTTLNVGKGAYIFYRGDRTKMDDKTKSPYLDAESIVMTFKGTLNQKNVTVALARANLLGNPYAATIDWNAVTKTSNVSSVIRVWNPRNRQYSTYNGENGVNDGTRYIGPGQAFFVQTSNALPASVTFTESAKVVEVAQSAPLYNVVMSVKESNIFGEMMGDNTSNNSTVEELPSKIRINISKENTENSDEALIVLKRNEVATVAGYDVERMGGEAVFLSSLSSEGKQMAINYMPHASMVSSIKLGVNADVSGNYNMSFELSDMPVGYEAKLKDNYLNTVTDLNTANATYAISIDKAIATSFGNNRLEILFTPVATLPVVISEFTGNKINEGVLLRWKTSSEDNNSHFDVQRAGEEQIYTSIGTISANQNGTYSLLDKSPLSGNNYYKLVQVDKNGTINPYSKLVAIKYDLNASASNGILVYPTVVESTFTLKYNGELSSNSYVIKIADLTGKEVYSNNVDKMAIANGYVGALSSVSSGVYFATLVDLANGKKIGVAKVIKK